MSKHNHYELSGEEPLPESRSGRTVLEVARLAAVSAGDAILAHFNHSTTLKHKGKSNITTDADFAAENAIKSVLETEFPSHNIIAEESGNAERQSEFSWIVDPLDGTNNFLFGIPYFAVTLALTRGDEVLVGLTYDPVRREIFHARSGEATCLNGKPVAASGRSRLSEAMIGFDVGYKPEKGLEVLHFAPHLWRQVHGIRLMGSAALGMAYVACGRLDVYCHRCLYPWDIAAGLLLVRCSGGMVTDWDGSPATPGTEQIIAAGKSVHAPFRDWYRSWELARQ